MFATAVANAFAAPPSALPGAPSLEARQYVLLDPVSGQILASQAPDAEAAPASLTKMMTAYLSFEALKAGRLKLDQTVPVSVAAWKAGGSTMFLQPNLPVTVEELIRGMVIVSGNDAAIAIAEALAGNEASFAAMMNAKAKQLGLSHTRYDNVNGLPTAPNVVSARDMAMLAEAIMRDFPEYMHYFSEQTFSYNRITQRNWNPLVFSDPTITGMKTGHTDEAGYCLVATSARQGRPLIAVVLGSTTRQGSASGTEALLNFGYRATETHLAYKAGRVITQSLDTDADPGRVPVGIGADTWVTVPAGMWSKLQPRIALPAKLPLPLTRGQVVGTLELGVNGRKLTEIPLVALAPVEKAGFVMRNWNKLKATVGMQ